MHTNLRKLRRFVEVVCIFYRRGVSSILQAWDPLPTNIKENCAVYNAVIIIMSVIVTMVIVYV